MTSTPPKKSLGQNFLVDENAIQDLTKAANIKFNDIVLEIGAGDGRVTKELAKRAKEVIAVEIDNDLIPILKENLQDFKNVQIINQDILKFEFWNLEFGTSDYKVTGSIPYQITSPLIHKLVIEEPKPELVVLLIQKEVAQKITAKPPKATYLSNFVQTTYYPTYIKIVDKSAFRPIPKVDGAIIRLKNSKKILIKDYEKFSKFLHHGFSQPRKMLNKIFKKEILQKANINPQKRAANLFLTDWLKIYKMLY